MEVAPIHRVNNAEQSGGSLCSWFALNLA